MHTSNLSYALELDVMDLAVPTLFKNKSRAAQISFHFCRPHLSSFSEIVLNISIINA
jgi:hypothetical protein